FSGNTFDGNGEAGFRQSSGSVDLGSGTVASPGGNTFQNNGGFDLVNETGLEIKAEGNFWDHTDSTEIDTLDISDDDENAARGAVDFVPVGR
ncbi:DUF1565 domain-containing protein, partial [candidate division GN15 bacterium]|nr:DUF1565 domain-containing protein [candidate division GN15 bacterium]